MGEHGTSGPRRTPVLTTPRALLQVHVPLPPGTHAGITCRKWKHGPGLHIKEVKHLDQM
jgi:hypothetical protein